MSGGAGEALYEHRYAGVPGLVVRSKNQRTRSLVALYHASQAGRAASGGVWLLVCKADGIERHYLRRDEAARHMSAGDWCPACLPARPLPVAPDAAREGQGST